MRCSSSTGVLPRLGNIRSRQSIKALARKIVEGKAKILSAAVFRTGQRWFVSFAVEVEREIPDRHPRPRRRDTHRNLVPMGAPRSASISGLQT